MGQWTAVRFEIHPALHQEQQRLLLTHCINNGGLYIQNSPRTHASVVRYYPVAGLQKAL
jgi:hypothetical protein